LKTCSKCGENKPLELFYKKPKAKDGRHPHCIACHKEMTRSWEERNPTVRARLSREQRERAGEHSLREYHRQWYLRNREKRLEQCEAWYLANPGKNREKAALRRAQTRNATPVWVDRVALQAIYEACPPGYEVDHIIPLKGKNVCGLHVPCNLQYLLMVENRRKYNRIEEDEHGKAA
jgi:hypothetical protein